MQKPNYLAQRIILPNEKILQERIDTLDLPPHFDKQTQLASNLSNDFSCARIEDVINFISYAVRKYTTHIQLTENMPAEEKSRMIQWADRKKPELIKSLLQEHETILNELQKAKL